MEPRSSFQVLSRTDPGDDSFCEYRLEKLLPRDEDIVVRLIRENLTLTEAGSSLISTFKRIENLLQNYNQAGHSMFILKDPTESVLGCVGVGPLKGLPLSDGIGEIRDLVVEAHYRGRGLGRKLLLKAIDEARAFDFQKLYLETTQGMAVANQLFRRCGFVPIIHSPIKGKGLIEVHQNDFISSTTYFYKDTVLTS